MLDISITHDMFAHYLEWALRDPGVAYYVDWVSSHPQHRGSFYTRLKVLNDRFRKWEKRWAWFEKWFGIR